MTGQILIQYWNMTEIKTSQWGLPTIRHYQHNLSRKSLYFQSRFQRWARADRICMHNVLSADADRNLIPGCYECNKACATRHATEFAEKRESDVQSQSQYHLVVSLLSVPYRWERREFLSGDLGSHHGSHCWPVVVDQNRSNDQIQYIDPMLVSISQFPVYRRRICHIRDGRHQIPSPSQADVGKTTSTLDQCTVVHVRLYGCTVE